jgi:hypothetical protein
MTGVPGIRGPGARPDQPTIMPPPPGDRTDPAVIAAPSGEPGDATDPNQAAIESGPIGPPIDARRAHNRPDTAQETVERPRQDVDDRPSDRSEDIEQTTEREKPPGADGQQQVMSTASPDLPEPTTAQLSADGPAPACPQCESPMSWVDKHLRFYCSSCRMYF